MSSKSAAWFLLVAVGAAGALPAASIPRTEALPCGADGKFEVSYLPAVTELGLLEWEPEYAAFAGHWKMTQGRPTAASLPSVNRIKLWCEKSRMRCTEAIASLRGPDDFVPNNALSLHILRYEISEWTGERITARHFGGASRHELSLVRKTGVSKTVRGERATLGAAPVTAVYVLD